MTSMGQKLLSLTWRTLKVAFIVLVLAMLLGGSRIPGNGKVEQIRYFTRNIEFNYVSWIVDAFGIKVRQSALDTATYMSQEQRKQVVLDYLELVHAIQTNESNLREIYANPNIQDPGEASREISNTLAELHQERRQVEPLAEAIVQSQVAEVVAKAGLSVGGQSLPPVLFHSTPLPYALIVSPRTAISQLADISLVPDLTLDQMVDLENEVEDDVNVSALVVPIGGVGVYPTMIEQTSDINRLAEVVAHEWIHNYLTVHPLGASYLNSPELRVMNETTAAIAGKELGRAVVAAFYPEYLPPPEPPIQPQPQVQPGESQEPQEFNFRQAMHETRINVDRLLAEGRVQEAETYMEARRIFIWNHGYHIRKLNQAYFAFYGAYADQPGGAAGEDPVGAAVRALRETSPNLTAFVNRIAWMWSFEQLQQYLSEAPA